MREITVEAASAANRMRKAAPEPDPGNARHKRLQRLGRARGRDHLGQGYNTPAELGPGRGVSIPGRYDTYDGAAGHPDDTPSEKNGLGLGVSGPDYDPTAVGEPNGDSPSEMNGREPGAPAAAPAPAPVLSDYGGVQASDPPMPLRPTPTPVGRPRRPLATTAVDPPVTATMRTRSGSGQ